MYVAWLFLMTCSLTLFPQSDGSFWDRWGKNLDKQIERTLEREMNHIMTMAEKEVDREVKFAEKEIESALKAADKEILRAKGPKDCKRVKNFKNKQIYPDTRFTVCGMKINGKRIYKQNKYRTYKCTDKPRYKKPFYRLETQSEGRTKDGKERFGNSKAVSYCTESLKDFDWEPDVPSDEDEGCKQKKRRDRKTEK